VDLGLSSFNMPCDVDVFCCWPQLVCELQGRLLPMSMFARCDTTMVVNFTRSSHQSKRGRWRWMSREDLMERYRSVGTVDDLIKRKEARAHTFGLWPVARPMMHICFGSL
jgi:hypothetical protein